MKPGLTLRNTILAVCFSTTAHAQLVKPIDLTKQADVTGKTVNFGNVQFDTLSQPLSDLPRSPLSKDNVEFPDLDQKKSDVNQKKMSFETLDMSTVSQPTVTRANFTAKRAAVDMSSHDPKKQLEQTRKKAQINERQIRPFTPGGEEDLKRQLNEPPLEAH